MNLSEQLTVLGIKKDAASVYLALLELGASSVLNIAKHTGIKRSTVYDMVRELQRLDLVNQEFSGNKKLLVASDPEQLVERAQASTQILMQALPALQALRGEKNSAPQVMYFEGVRGIKKVYEQILLKRQNYDVIGSNKYFFNLDEKYFKEFVTKRRPLTGIHTRLLLPRDQSSLWQKQEEKKQNISVRFLPKQFNISENIMILSDRLVLDTQSAKAKGVAVVILHSGLVTSFQTLFDFMWQSADKE